MGVVEEEMGQMYHVIWSLFWNRAQITFWSWLLVLCWVTQISRGVKSLSFTQNTVKCQWLNWSTWNSYIIYRLHCTTSSHWLLTNRVSREWDSVHLFSQPYYEKLCHFFQKNPIFRVVMASIEKIWYRYYWYFCCKISILFFFFFM